MRVLHFYKTAYPDSMGGTQQVIHQIASGACRYGIETDVLSLANKGQKAETLEINGYRLHRARLDFEIASTGFSTSAIWLFTRLARDADVIHYHFPWPFMDLVHFLTQVKKPTVVSYNSDIIRQKTLLRFYRPLRDAFLSSVDRIVAASPNYLATSDVLKKRSDKVSVIPYGLDNETYPQPTDECLDFWREKFGRKFFLFIGVLRYYKGLHILIEAAQGLNYPIVIMGAGPIEQELKKQVARLGLSNVFFLGFLPDTDKVALLSLCFSVIFPSHLRSEAFGISLLEGAMYGKPLISSEIGTGTTFVNIANETGLVVPPGDPVALRKAMIHLWEHPELAGRMGCCAKLRYLNTFTADRMVRDYVHLYQDIIDTGNAERV